VRSGADSSHTFHLVKTPLSLSLSKASGSLIHPDPFIAAPIFLFAKARNGPATLRAGAKKG